MARDPAHTPMVQDYDALYKTTPDALGPPSQDVLDVFSGSLQPPLRVLDAGCGQGRDALALARLGYSVHGVDLSLTGLRAMFAAAAREGLDVTGEAADLTAWSPRTGFDVLLCDRVLHMLDHDARLRVLAELLSYVADGGAVVIIDEPRIMPDLIAVIEATGPVDPPFLSRRNAIGVTLCGKVTAT